MKKALYKNNAHVVYLFVLHRLAGKCSKIYNSCRTIVRLIKPLVLRRFHCRCGLCKISAVLGPVPERRNNSIPVINVPYFRDNFILGINCVPERRNNAIKGINLG